jgi:hypothetical protein
VYEVIPLERITERVTRNGHPDAEGTPTYLLSIPEFFNGNDVDGSIGCNLDPMPSPTTFRSLLQSILDRPDVADVRVQITAFDEPDWPFSDTVWVFTTSSESEVSTWFPPELAPNEIWKGWIPGRSYEDCPVPAGFSPVACWWD